MNDNKEHVFTVRELCARWRVCHKTIMDAIHRGDLHAFRVGKSKRSPYRVTLDEVKRYEEQRGAA